ncbi:MAG: enoyl-CoA hydratase/isomerase family protein [Planctomycetes bacterium]|nr:enoyl-CoA hydratase/isomerase family protein [Planctomycetota bacterium]
MAEPLVKVKVHDAVGTIILNRPEKRNALCRAMLEEIRQAFRDLHGERRVRAVILTGAGSAFCAGMDLAEMLDTTKQENAMQVWHEDAVLFRDLLLETMLRFPKPIIAAVNGPALAGGAGLMLASDIVVAADSATFGLPEPRRGLVAGIVSPLLTFRLGAGHAARLLLTGEVIDAAEAHRLGLFHELTAADNTWVRAAEIVNQCAQCAPEALQLTKRMLNETIGEHLVTLLTAGAACSATARTTEAAEEGLAAFVEKREPVWP